MLNTTQDSRTLENTLSSDSGQRARQVQRMFNSIAPRYDLLNRVLSGGIDLHWRNRMVQKLSPAAGDVILDLATGTADVALEIMRQTRSGLKRLVGIDFSPAMLHLAKAKLGKKPGGSTVYLAGGAAEAIPVGDARFDGLTVAFGVRNFADLDQGLAEMARVLKPGGRAIILEFSMPPSRFLAWIYRLYFSKVLPLLGGIVSGQPKAYRYLPDSVEIFPVRDTLKKRLLASGFDTVEYEDMTFGIVTLYRAIKAEAAPLRHSSEAA